jgi:hypothetical protein
MTDPRGVYCLGQNTYGNPNIIGRRFRTEWATIQPNSPDEYDWSTIDNDLSKAEKNTKRLSLSVSMTCNKEGGENSIPQWLLDDGVKTYKLPPTQNDKTLTVVLPWDKKVQPHMLNFQTELCKRYDGLVEYVAMGGLGCWPIESIVAYDPQDVGLTESELLQAWTKNARKLTDHHANFLGMCPFVFTAVPPCKGANAETALIDFVNSAVKRHQGRFGIMNCALSANTKETYVPAGLIKQHSATSPVGFQMVWSAIDDPDRTKGNLDQCLKNGIALGAHYIEIYPKDADAPENQTPIINANESMGA